MNTEQAIAEWAREQRGEDADPRDPRVRDRQLRAALADAIRERRQLATAPEPIEDLVRRMEEEVDRVYVEQRADRGRALVSALSGDLTATRDGDVRIRKGSLAAAFTYGLRTDLTVRDLILFAPDTVKSALAGAMRSHQYAPGLPAAARPAALQQADTRIAALRQEHVELVDVAARHGVQLEYLPEVKAQKGRDAARERQERQQREADERKRAELDAKVRTGPSDYIQSAGGKPSA